MSITNLTVVAAAQFPVVSLAEVYAHLRLDPEGSPPTHPNDAMLARHVQAATEWVERATRRALVAQTLRATYPGFSRHDDAQGWRGNSCPQLRSRSLLLPRPPIIEVISVAYADSDGGLVVVDPALYFVTDDLRPELQFSADFSPPSVAQRSDAVRVTYRAGYRGDGSPDDADQAEAARNIPSALKEAVLLGVQELYDDLSPQDVERLHRTREALVQPFRIQLL